ncbi:MAG TPA: ISAs1 family transposase [Hyphomonadaceae bacterium]|nr:ISAs1 family transposase [Hyphomonadaceae bacterium]
MSQERIVVGFAKHFEGLTDPRIDHTRWHDLLDILVIAVCGTICGCDSWEDLPRFAKAKQDWLRSSIRLENGIPSADTFSRVFQRLNVREFMECLSSWVEDLRARVKDVTGDEIVAIDGKTMRGSSDAYAGCRPLHLVRAWAAENRLVLGQEACAEKSNEITAIPKLLDLIEISGAIVTIDAMGCQTEIAAKIVDKGADYVLSAKDNQPKLCEEIGRAFDAAANEAAVRGTKSRVRTYTTKEKSRGRTEERSYYIMPAPAAMKHAGRWKKLASLGMVMRRRTVKGNEEISVHYYILSLPPHVKRFAKAVRSHWGIENRLHWLLDVEFAEDASRIRKGASPEIASMLRQLALMVLQQDTSLKEKTIRGKRKIVGWNNAALDALLRSAQAL